MYYLYIVIKTNDMESTEDILKKLDILSAQLCYTTNPLRKGWDLHELDKVDFVLNDNPEFYTKYYLINCYNDALTSKERDILWGYGDGLIQRSFCNWLEGRTSLSDQINITMETWEERFKNDMNILNSIVKKRNEFIKNNGYFL